MPRLPVWFVSVIDVHHITPAIRRITFGGDDLGGIHFDEPDQQVKLYFPKPGQRVPRLPEPDGADVMGWYRAYNAIPADERPWMRSFTIRRHDPARGRIDIDFVLHDHGGPAVRWASSATVGDILGVFGPSAAFARPVPLSRSIAAADWVLLAGDQTALPALSTVVEFLPADTRALAYVEVRDAAEEQRLTTRGALTTHWLHGGDDPAGTALLAAIRAAEFPPGTPFAWVAGEAGTARALRRHLVDDRGLDKRAVDFAGYWRRELTQDDAPTEDDLAEARERLADAGYGG